MMDDTHSRARTRRSKKENAPEFSVEPRLSLVFSLAFPGEGKYYQQLPSRLCSFLTNYLTPVCTLDRKD